MPWAVLEQDTDLSPKGRIRAEILQETILWCKWGGGEEVGKRMISYFSIGVRKTFVVSHINL